MKKFAAILCASLAAPSGVLASKDLRDLEAEKILFARSTNEVVEAVVTTDGISVARAVCDAQLKSGLVPTGCFKTVDLEVRAGILKATRARAMRSFLDETCRERARAGSAISEMERALAEPEISRVCREAVRTRLGELQYMTSHHSPTEIFRRRGS